MLNEIIFTNRAVEVTDAVQGVARCYLFIWGDSENRDSFSTFFAKDRPPQYSYKGRIEGTPVLYEHAQDSAIGNHAIGEIIRSWFDNTGLCCEVQLDRSSPFYSRILSEIRSGKLKTSSATTPHAAEFHEDGAFRSWLLAELSFTANPSESRMPAVEIIRSAEQERNAPGASDPLINLPTDTRNMEAIMPDLQTPAPAPEAQRADLNEIVKAAMDAGFTADEIMAAVQALAAPEVPRADAAPEDEEDMPVARSITAADLLAHLSATRGQSEVETLRAENAALKAKRNAAPAPQPRPAHPSNGSVSVSEPRKFWGRSHSDMMFSYEIMRSKGVRISEDFMRTLAGRAETAIAKGDSIMTSPHVRSRLPATRANEIMTSTATNAGDEWVSIAYSDQLWESARHIRIWENAVSKGMIVEEIPAGAESVYVPTEGADPTVYTISQSADDASGRPTVTTTASRIGTDRVLLTPGTLAARTQYTFVFDEDSIIAVAPQLNRQMQEVMQDTIEQLMLNGDQATSGNINYDDGTPATQYYMASQSSFRKYALVTGSSTSRSGTTIDEDDYIETFALLPTVVQAHEEDLMFIVDPATYRKSLGIAAVKTRDVNSSMTVESGVLSRIWGIDLFKSGHLPLTASDGKVTYNAAGTLGSILCVYPRYWAFGWKRHINIEADRDISAQTNIVVATMRAGLVPRGAGASTISYNLTV